MNNEMTKICCHRAALVTAALAAAFVSTLVMASLLDHGGLLQTVVLTIFFVMTAWITLWFGIAAVGFTRTWQNKRAVCAHASQAGNGEHMSKTAILIPIYNEEPAAVFACLQAMRESLEATGHAAAFDFFLLSDTTDADIWLDEERRWLQLGRAADRGPTVFYRRRCENVCRKSGNIADFCKRWGAAYRYMVVLDADSLLDGPLLVELVRRMENDPHLGILQTVPLPLGGDSIVARCQQFAARLCGRSLAEGLDWFVGDGGNYWGHNAIIRTDAFVRHCGLPDLPGSPPLGGQILSHDFVEAALVRRAGFKVRLATDLPFSYEHAPTTLPDLAQRDWRWCQGNLQHAQLLFSQNIPLANRFHFATGLMAYAASPLWLLFVILWPLAHLVNHFSITAKTPFGFGIGFGPAMFAFVMSLLIAPLIGGVALVLKQPREARSFGSPVRVVCSTVWLLLLSVLIAPIMMLLHTMFVVNTLRGKRAAWISQNRHCNEITWSCAWHVHGWQTMLGVAAAMLAYFIFPSSLPWLLPALVGLALAVPVSVAISSGHVGRWFKRLGLLEVPEERHVPAIVERYRQLLKEDGTRPAWPRRELFQRLLHDPIWLRHHFTAIQQAATERQCAESVIRKVESTLAASDWAAITNEEKCSVLCDRQALTRLHREIWLRPEDKHHASPPLPVYAATLTSL